MPDLDSHQWRMLMNLATGDGIGPDRPYTNDDGRTLMRLGLIELVDPPQMSGRSKGLPYAHLLGAGYVALSERFAFLATQEQALSRAAARRARQHK